MKKVFCSNCKKETQTCIVREKETFSVRGEDIEIISSIAKCKKCDTKMFDEELDEKNIECAFNKYREKHSLLMPSEIQKIREKYSLSQRALADLLGCGEITIHRYENGGIQDKVHNELLMLISKPENMSEIYEKNKHILSPSLRSGLGAKIEGLLKREIKPKFNTSLKQWLMAKKKMGEYTGYREFDLEKMKNSILFMAGSLKTSYKNKSLNGVYMTKLNKLLWYADFLNFKNFAVSITGNIYTHLQFGPTPDDYEFILGLMLQDGLIDKEELVFSENNSGELFRSIKRFDATVFLKKEIQVMEFVMNKFRDSTCKQISKYSHEEKAYKKSNMHEKISYCLAEKLSLTFCSR